MSENPLVSCLCVTRDRVPMLRCAVDCFVRQTYEPRELVVVYEADDLATHDYLAAVRWPSIRPVQVPVSPRLRLGALRNLSIAASKGDLLAQWDDDDWHNPQRLSQQIAALRASGKAGCVLTHWFIFDAEKRTAYLSARRGWEGSLVAQRAAVPPYADLSQGEDTPVMIRMYENNQLVLLERPELYVYVFHGGNTWRRQHWDQNIFPNCQRLGPEDAERLTRLLPLHCGIEAERPRQKEA